MSQCLCSSAMRTCYARRRTWGFLYMPTHDKTMASSAWPLPRGTRVNWRRVLPPPRLGPALTVISETSIANCWTVPVLPVPGAVRHATHRHYCRHYYHHYYRHYSHFDVLVLLLPVL
jgi:hypothetical protein